MPKQVPAEILTAVESMLKPYGGVCSLFTETSRGESASVPRWMTIAEAMSYSRSSRATIWRWMKSGDVRHRKFGSARSGKVLICGASLESFIGGAAGSEVRNA